MYGFEPSSNNSSYKQQHTGTHMIRIFHYSTLFQCISAHTFNSIHSNQSYSGWNLYSQWKWQTAKSQQQQISHCNNIHFNYNNRHTNVYKYIIKERFPFLNANVRIKNVCENKCAQTIAYCSAAQWTEPRICGFIFLGICVSGVSFSSLTQPNISICTIDECMWMHIESDVHSQPRKRIKRQQQFNEGNKTKNWPKKNACDRKYDVINEIEWQRWNNNKRWTNSKWCAYILKLWRIMNDNL